MVKRNPKISIIITTKNEAEVIKNLLESIKNQSYKNFEVILVDNYSSDKTIEIAKKHNIKIYQKGPERSTQRNYGVEKASGDYVLILDADMMLTDDVLYELSKIKTKMGLIPEKSYGTGYFVKFKVFEREFYEGEDSIEAPRFFNRKLFLKYEGYDKGITGPEDYDLPLRMKKDGYKTSRIKSYILHNERKFNPLKSAKKKFYYASKSTKYILRHREMMILQGNLILRPVFIKKWKKLLSYPFLTFGMLLIKTLEGVGAVLGFIYGKFKK